MKKASEKGMDNDTKQKKCGIKNADLWKEIVEES